MNYLTELREWPDRTNIISMLLSLITKRTKNIALHHSNEERQELKKPDKLTKLLVSD